MAYTINHYDGSTLIVLNDGITDETVTDLTLIGKNFAGYGQFLNENFIYLLENFSNATSPAIPLQGQLWWNSSSKSLQVWTGIAWKGISSTAAQATAPSNPNVGDLWWDTVNNQLKVLQTLPSTWTVIGPQYSTGLGLTGAIATTITDSLFATHIVVELVVNNIVVGIFSRDTPAYTISSPPNFSLIKPGLTLADDPTVNYQFTGNVSNALLLNGFSTYLRSDLAAGAQTMYPALTISNNSGLIVGTSNDLSINSAFENVNLAGQVPYKNTVLSVNTGSESTVELTLDATLGRATVPNLTYAVTQGPSITNKYYVDNTALNSIDYVNGNVTVSARSATVTTTTSTTPAQTIASVSASTYRSAEFIIQASDTVALSYQLSKILVVQDGSTAYYTEYGSVNSGNVIATYSATVSGANLLLQTTPASGNSTTFKVTTISVTS